LTRWAAVKAALAAAGFAIGLAGMVLELRVLVSAGVGLLAGAFVLRFAERREPSPRGDT
jgi:hypothetical protein